MDTLNLISLILSLMMLSFVVIGVIYGLIVGFKKSLISGIYNLLLVVILILITNTITNLVLNADVSFLSLNIEGTSYSTLGDYIVAMLESNPEIADLIANNEGMKDVILSLPSLLASPFMFVILFWLLKLVLFIISLPIRLIVFICTGKKRKEKKAKNIDDRGRVIKPKKRRLLGMACGLVVGLIAVFATMVPIFGLGSALIKLDSVKVDSNSNLVVYAENSDDNTNENTKQSLLSLMVGQDVSEKIVSTYNSNIGISVSRIIGMETLGSRAFNNLAKANINGEEVHLIDDLTMVLNVYEDVLDISEYLEKETLTEAEMTDALTKLDRTIDKVFEVKFLTAVGNTVMPVVVDKILNDPDFFIQLPDEIKTDEVKNYIATEALNIIKDYDFSFIKSTLKDLTSILTTLNENKILTPVYNSLKTETELSESDYVDLLKASNSDFASQISNKITNITFIKDMSPALIDGIFEGIFEAIGKTYETNNITTEKASSTFALIIENLIDCVKTLDMSSELYVTKPSFSHVGKILDAVKDPAVLSSTQYADLVDYIQSQALSYVSNSPIDLTGVIENISNVSSWQTELEKIANSFEELEYIYSEFNKSDIDIKTLNFTKLGKLFDNLETTTLFGDEILPIYNDVLDEAKETYPDYADAIEILKIQSTDLTSVNLTKVEWESELTALSPLVSKLFDFENISLSGDNQQDAQTLTNIVETFDTVEQNTNSKIYSKKMSPLLVEALKIAKNKDAENADLYDQIIARINNRKSGETLTNCVEKGVITYAVNKIITDMTTEHRINEALTNAKDYIIENNTLSKLIESMNTIESEIDKLSSIDASDISTVDTDALADTLNTIKNTGSFPVSFTNTILSNLLGEVDYSSVPDEGLKADIAGYIALNQRNLASSTFTVTNNTYKEILDGLKDLFNA